jgi:hypothetical protein
MAPEPPTSRIPRTWHEATPKKTQAARPLSRRRKKIFAVLAAMLALVGAILGWLMFYNPFKPPDFLTIAILQYKPDLFPANAFAGRDSKALLRHFPEGQDALDHQAANLLRQRLERLRDRSGKALVVHLCGYARVDQGQLYLLPADAVPDDPGTWIAMSEVLAAIRRCPADHKLMILDITHSLDDPRLGLVSEDIAGRFKELFDSEDQGNLQVLCACAPGQLSLVSEDLPLSVFGYYLDEGLRGHADGYNHGKSDGRVTVQELADFVTARVDRWAIFNRGLRQTPLLLRKGEGNDFALVSLEQSEPRGLDAPPPRPYPAELSNGWKMRDQWIAQGVDQFAPRLVRDLEAFLLRQEQQWRGGARSEIINDDARTRLAHAKNEVARMQKRLPRPAETHSLLLDAQPELKKPNSLVEETLRPMLAKVAGIKRDDVDNLKKTFAEKTKKATAAQLCATILHMAWANDSPCTEKVHFEFLNDLVRARLPAPHYAEMVYFERLAGPKLSAKNWPRDTVNLLFRVVEEAGKIWTCNPREFPWVRHALEAAADKQRQGEDLLLGGDPDALARANELLDAALQAYRQIDTHLRIVHEAQGTVDDALRLLPTYLPYLAAQSRWQDGAASAATWFQACKVADETERLLAQPPTEKPPPEETIDQLRDATRLLKKMLGGDVLGRPVLSPDPALGLGQEGPDADAAAMINAIRALREIDAILLTSWPKAAEREALRTARRSLAHALHEKTRKLDKAENSAHKPTRVPDDWIPGAAARLQEERDLRFRLARTLLKIGGLPEPEIAKLDKVAAEVGKRGNLDAGEKLAAALRRAWAVLQPRQSDLKKLDWRAGDRLTRILHPLNRDSENNLLDVHFQPTLDIRRAEAQAYWRWLAARYRRQIEALADVAGYAEFFRRLAQDYEESVNF